MDGIAKQGPRLVYIAGPYRAPTPGLVRANVGRAMDAMAELFLRGFAVICPHTMTHTMELYGMPDEVFLANGIAQVLRCDAALVLPGHEHSEGSRAELETARQNGIPIFTSIIALAQYEWPPELPFPTLV